MQNDALLDLVNSNIKVRFKGRDYEVSKANIRQVVQYHERVKQLRGKEGGDQYLVAYCLSLLLKKEIPDITEDMVLDDSRGDIDVMEALTYLGFMSPDKLEMAKRLQERLGNLPTGLKSSPPSPTAPDGPQEKSPN